MSQDSIYIIDTFSLMFQVFHAIPPMTGTQGQPTNAVFGFTRDVLAILDRKPKFLVCAFDSPGPGQREVIYPKYKANRAEMPEDLRPQIPLIKQLLEGFRIPILECPTWEADDVIATVTAQAVARNLDVVIVSTDKDARQLLGPKVRMLNCRKNTFLDEAGLMDDWGVRPDQVVDFQSLVGDSVDNVPGVPNVGPKTARTLIEKFGTLENVLANADKAPGKKLAENLRTYADQARLSRDLVRLRQDLPISFDFDTARIHEPDHQSLYDLFNLLGFRRHASQMRERMAALPDGETEPPAVASASGSKTLQTPGSQLFHDPAMLLSSLQSLGDAADVFIEVTTSGAGVRQQRLNAVAMSTGESTILLDFLQTEDL